MCKALLYTVFHFLVLQAEAIFVFCKARRGGRGALLVGLLVGLLSGLTGIERPYCGGLGDRVKGGVFPVLQDIASVCPYYAFAKDRRGVVIPVRAVDNDRNRGSCGLTVKVTPQRRQRW
jgi:hypothetical protein